VSGLFDMALVLSCLLITFWMGYEMGVNKDEK